ncbi:MAG: hypothetical protein LUG62_00980 [Clostridiales bacterium]|nr:hypothetical protein [Clostridiales bacterium]
MGLYTKIIDLQKLHLVWKQVYRNRPAEGVDHVTCDIFENDRENELKLLAAQLREHTYECQPVRLCPLYKGEKVRYISLYCMRDKVVQLSVVNELSRLYEGKFPRCSFAYQSGKSALQAGQYIAEYTKKAAEKYALRTDIQTFFDCIPFEKLFPVLRRDIKEEDVLELIKNILTAASMERDGTLNKKQMGLYQGSSLSPVLSNIYMMELDKKIEREVSFYVRYSDDLLLAFDTCEQAEAYKVKLSSFLEDLGLALNQGKTEIVQIRDGFEYLGYRFDHTGMTVPDKARIHLRELLEDIWLDSGYGSFELRIRKALEIVNGWEQYFSPSEENYGILEYTVWLYQTGKKSTVDLAEAVRLRAGIDNPYRDVAEYLISFWEKNHLSVQSLREYEIYYGLPERWEGEIQEEQLPLVSELLKLYEKYIVKESGEVRTEIIQLYTDLKKYRNAAALSEKERPEWRSSEGNRKNAEETADVSGEKIQLNEKELNRFMEVFAGREDVYAINEMSESSRRICEEVSEPLLPDVVQAHLAGVKTVSTYIQRSNATVKYLVIDLDVSKAVLLSHGNEVLGEYMEKCLALAVKCCSEMRHLGIQGYLESSGCRGYHVWVFFDEWLPVRYVNGLADVIGEKIKPFLRDSGIQAEFFPNKTRVRNGKKAC